MIRSWNGKTPKIHPTAFIGEAIYLMGNGELDENSTIWPGVVIHGDNGEITIGKNTTIQDNTAIPSNSDSRIGDSVIMSHNLTWHGRILYNNCVVGNGAPASDGVEAGESSVIAAGAVALENVRIPGRTMVVGISAKLLGPISSRHEELTKDTARHLVEAGQSFKAAGL